MINRAPLFNGRPSWQYLGRLRVVDVALMLAGACVLSERFCKSVAESSEWGPEHGPAFLEPYQER